MNLMQDFNHTHVLIRLTKNELKIMNVKNLLQHLIFKIPFPLVFRFYHYFNLVKHIF